MTNEDSAFTRVSKWELNALIVEALLFASLAMGVLTAFGRRGTLGIHLPDYVWFGAGFFVLFVLLLPIQSVLARRKGSAVRVSRALAGAVVGAIVAAAIIRILG